MTDTTSTPAPTPAPTSGLSPADLAASSAMGLRPLGVAQGYYCGRLVEWTKLEAHAVYNYDCPHNSSRHRPGWVGVHREWDHQWINAFNVAFQRLRDDARKMGAHGVIDCRSDVVELDGGFEIEARLSGTAVVVEGAEPLAEGAVWSTSLGGYRLARLVEGGYVPGDLWYAHATVAIGGGCVMEQYGEGYGRAGERVAPMRDALALARRYNIDGIRDSQSPAAVYGMRRRVVEVEGEGFHHLVCTSFGERVREVRTVPAPAYPAPALGLA